MCNEELEGSEVDQYALAQVQMICDNRASEGSVIRVMPDVHPGKVGPIGLTMTLGERVMPNLLGVDIGCGMLMAKVKTKGLEFQKLDKVILHCPFFYILIRFYYLDILTQQNLFLVQYQAFHYL